MWFFYSSARSVVGQTVGYVIENIGFIFYAAVFSNGKRWNREGAKNAKKQVGLAKGLALCSQP
jgi:hypothetical protein